MTPEAGAQISGSDTARPDADSQIAGMVFAVLLIDGDARIAEANYAAENLLGTSIKRMVERPLTEIIAPADERVEARIATPGDALVARDIAIRAGGAEMQVNLTISPLAKSPGWRVVTLSPAGLNETGSDEAGGAALGAPSILAHEIKNPLAAIRGAAQLAARKLPDADRKLARVITDEVDRIARLIDRMQQLGSRGPDETTPINQHEAIRAAIATVRAGANEQVTIREEFDPSLPPALANREALEQVLINLISNARDAALSAASAGGEEAEITVRTRFASAPAFNRIAFGRKVRLPIEITVTDNGAGIDPALRDHVFEPFVSSKPSGQGLGLALVRKLVRDMNGSISHERDARAGLTHFRVHLPRAKNHED